MPPKPYNPPVQISGRRRVPGTATLRVAFPTLPEESPSTTGHGGGQPPPAPTDQGRGKVPQRMNRRWLWVVRRSAAGLREIRQG